MKFKSGKELEKNWHSADAPPGFNRKPATMSYNTKPRAKFDETRLCVLDLETVASEEMPDGGFPPWPTHAPVCASMLVADLDNNGQWDFNIVSVGFEDPKAALNRIDELLKGRSCITFGGGNFDFRVLLLAAQISRQFSLASLVAAGTEPRYWSARHYDLIDRASNFGAARGASLERLSAALGISVKVTGHGSEVGELYARGDLESIVRYCETDVCATLLAYAFQRAIETGDASYHASLTWQFARWCEGQSHSHLAPYTHVRDGHELQRLSLLAQLDAAQDNARLNAEWRQQKLVDADFGDITAH